MIKNDHIKEGVFSKELEPKVSAEMERINIMRICSEKLAAEKIAVTDLRWCDSPTDDVHLFMAKDAKGNKVAFELSKNNEGDYIPCLTIKGNVFFYSTMAELSKYWQKHDIV